MTLAILNYYHDFYFTGDAPRKSRQFTEDPKRAVGLKIISNLYIAKYHFKYDHVQLSMNILQSIAFLHSSIYTNLFHGSK